VPPQSDQGNADLGTVRRKYFSIAIATNWPRAAAVNQDTHTALATYSEKMLPVPPIPIPGFNRLDKCQENGPPGWLS